MKEEAPSTPEGRDIQTRSGGGSERMEKHDHMHCTTKRNAVKGFACSSDLWEVYEDGQENTTMNDRGFSHMWVNRQHFYCEMIIIHIYAFSEIRWFQYCVTLCVSDLHFPSRVKNRSITRSILCFQSFWGMLQRGHFFFRLCTRVPTELVSVCLCRTGSVQQEQEWHPKDAIGANKASIIVPHLNNQNNQRRVY